MAGKKHKKIKVEVSEAAVEDSGAVDDADVVTDENVEIETEAGGEDQAAEEMPLTPEQELAKAQEEVTEWKDKFLRAKAEQQNALRRAANEREDAIRYANASLLRSLLDVADDFERTQEAAAGSDSVDAVVSGVKMIHEKVEKLLKDNGVQVIEAVGQPFDPNQHEALMQQSSTDYEPGSVIQEIQKGYTLRDRVLRPTKVIVCTAPATDDADEDATEDEE